MKPSEICAGADYERDDGRGPVERRFVTAMEAYADGTTVYYISGDLEDFTDLEDFARWAQRRIA